MMQRLSTQRLLRALGLSGCVVLGEGRLWNKGLWPKRSSSCFCYMFCLSSGISSNAGKKGDDPTTTKYGPVQPSLIMCPSPDMSSMASYPPFHVLKSNCLHLLQIAFRRSSLEGRQHSCHTLGKKFHKYFLDWFLKKTRAVIDLIVFGGSDSFPKQPCRSLFTKQTQSFSFWPK